MILRAVIGQFQVRKLPYGPPAVDYFYKTGITKAILLASFARSVGQVMDPRFFLPCFHGPRASRLGHKRKETSLQKLNNRKKFSIKFS